MVFEVIGAMCMGTHVAKTITRGIVDPANYVDTPEYYVLAMPAVLAGASLVAISCTIYGLPISMSKGTIFGLVSVGLASIGTVDYKGVIKCVIGLIISPLLGGAIACILHLILIITVKKKDDPVRAAKIA